MKGQTHITRGTAALHCGETPETWERGGLPSVQTKRKPRPALPHGGKPESTL